MALSLFQWLVVLAGGLCFSTLGTLVGLGGGIFMIPLLVFVVGAPLKTAIAVTTFCLLPSALLSTFYNARAKHIDYFAGVALEIPTIAGAVLGALLISVLPVRPLETLFAGLVVYMGQRIFRGRRPDQKPGLMERLNNVPPVVTRKSAHGHYHAGVLALALFGGFSGVLAGLFGIGGGIIKTPVMLKIFKMPARRATATALFMIVFTSATAAVSHWRQGRMDWTLALPLAGAFLAGSFVGNQIVGRIPARTLEKTLGCVMMAAAAAILVHAWLL